MQSQGPEAFHTDCRRDRLRQRSHLSERKAQIIQLPREMEEKLNWPRNLEMSRRIREEPRGVTLVAQN